MKTSRVKSKMKKFFVAFFLILTIFIMSCSKNGDESSNAKSKEVTISLWYTANESDPNDRDHKWNQENIKLFEQMNPGVKVIPTVIGGAGGDDYRTKLNAEIAAGNPPDVFMVWERGRLQPYVDAGMVLNLSPIISEDPELASIVNPENLGGMTFDGNVYAIPDSADLHGLFYNKELFVQCGVDIPKTNDELIAAAKKFREKGITPIAFGNSVAWVTMVPYSGYFYELAGAEAFNEVVKNGPIDFTDPMYIKPMEELYRIASNGVFSDNFNAVQVPESVAAFKEGKAAMLLQGTWQINGLVEAMGDNVGFFPMPTINGDVRIKSTAIPKGYSVSAKSKNQDIAIEFLKFMYSADRQTAYCDYGAIPAARNYKINPETTSSLKMEVIEVMTSDRASVPNIDIFCSTAVQPEMQKVVQSCASGTDIPTAFKNLQAFKEMSDL